MSDTFDFDHLEVAQENTAWCDLPELSPGARIQLRPATEANRGYYNGLLRRAGNRARRAVRTDRVTVEDAELNRSEDRELYPRFVIVGWEGVLNRKTNEGIPFSADHCREFCAKLPAWLFDRLRTFASTPERFLQQGDELPPDAQELAGN
jgi:hypothetical protein